ncbi:hypothetical protein CP532_2358 [Ophiocordyceps camponoti-leonardi (nom. inval.)]|nr:hypothetical protein CP532_2358 [Ophiocordyceps camponoti-leonardi (nom. inval.)]
MDRWRTLHIFRSEHNSRKLYVTDSFDGPILYSAVCGFYGQPHTTISREEGGCGEEKAIVGSFTLRGRKIDAETPLGPIRMKKVSFLRGSQYRFTDDGSAWRWKRDRSSIPSSTSFSSSSTTTHTWQNLVDDDDNVIARLEWTIISSKTHWSIAIPQTMPPPALDVILITALARLEAKWRKDAERALSAARNLRVTDSDKHTVLYTARCKTFGRPDMIINRGEGKDEKKDESDNSNNNTVGNITFHCWSSDIDAETPLGRIQMTKKSCFSGSHHFTCDGSTWCWKRDGGFCSDDLQLVDEKDQVVATVERPTWACKKQGTIRVLQKMPSSTLDVVVITALAKLEAKRRQERRNHAAAN